MRFASAKFPNALAVTSKSLSDAEKSIAENNFPVFKCKVLLQ
jgi:hypothetical protein